MSLMNCMRFQTRQVFPIKALLVTITTIEELERIYIPMITYMSLKDLLYNTFKMCYNEVIVYFSFKKFPSNSKSSVINLTLYIPMPRSPI